MNEPSLLVDIYRKVVTRELIDRRLVVPENLMKRIVLGSSVVTTSAATATQKVEERILRFESRMEGRVPKVPVVSLNKHPIRLKWGLWGTAPEANMMWNSLDDQPIPSAEKKEKEEERKSLIDKSEPLRLFADRVSRARLNSLLEDPPRHFENKMSLMPEV